MKLIIVTRWPLKAEAEAAWRANTKVSHVVSLTRPSSGTGTRIGSRVLGLGADSLAVAVKARRSAGGQARVARVISVGPWSAAACRTVGFRHIAAVGLSVKPGGRAWRALRWSLGDCPVVCHAGVEADRWIASGGQARTVLYGENFGVAPTRPVSGRPRVFVGGASDRDRAAIQSLTDEVQQDGEDVDVTIADGTGPRAWSGHRASVRWLPYVPEQVFLRELSNSNAGFLPLCERGRSSGQMVVVESLEAGLPTMVSPIAGLREYIDLGAGLVPWHGQEPILPTLLELASWGDAKRAEIRASWRDNFSLGAFVRNTAAALSEMGWPNAD